MLLGASDSSGEPCVRTACAESTWHIKLAPVGPHGSEHRFTLHIGDFRFHEHRRRAQRPEEPARFAASDGPSAKTSYDRSFLFTGLLRARATSERRAPARIHVERSYFDCARGLPLDGENSAGFTPLSVRVSSSSSDGFPISVRPRSSLREASAPVRNMRQRARSVALGTTILVTGRHTRGFVGSPSTRWFDRGRVIRGFPVLLASAVKSEHRSTCHTGRSCFSGVRERTQTSSILPLPPRVAWRGLTQCFQGVSVRGRASGIDRYRAVAMCASTTWSERSPSALRLISGCDRVSIARWNGLRRSVFTVRQPTGVHRAPRRS